MGGQADSGWYWSKKQLSSVTALLSLDREVAPTMYAMNYTTYPTLPSKNCTDQLFALTPLADGTPVTGIISEGRIIGTTATWRGIEVGTGFRCPRGKPYGKPYVDLSFPHPVWVIEKVFPVSTWSQHRKRLDAKPPRRMVDLLTHNIIEQIIERARVWHPELF